MTASPGAGAFAPNAANGPAPASSRVLSQARFEAASLLRNGEQLLVSLILPVLALIGLAVSSVPSLGAGRRIDLAVPGVLAMCVISAAFTSQAITIGFDRRYSVLKYLGTTPLGRSGLLAAKAVATLVVEAIQLVVISAIGYAMGWHPQLIGWPIAVVFIVFGTWAFVALAMLVGGTLRAEGVLALANLIWIVLIGAGGVLIPHTQLPSALAHIVNVLPSSALADGLRTAWVHGAVSWLDLGILAAWGAATTALAGRVFRWSD